MVNITLVAYNGGPAETCPKVLGRRLCFSECIAEQHDHSLPCPRPEEAGLLDAHGLRTCSWMLWHHRVKCPGIKGPVS